MDTCPQIDPDSAGAGWMPSLFLTDESQRRSLHLVPASSGSEQYKPGRPTVLVVDDERLLAETTGAILRSAGFEVKIAYNGWDALELAQSLRPDYLLTDILMPVMNGMELAITIKRMMPATRILLISGQAGISDILEEGRTNGHDFPLLAKPAHPRKVIETLKALSSEDI